MGSVDHSIDAYAYADSRQQDGVKRKRERGDKKEEREQMGYETGRLDNNQNDLIVLL